MKWRTDLRQDVVIVGAGAAGLAAAIYLSAKGFSVTVVEKEAAVGGKMREVPVGDGELCAPINAGPTVFTMKWVFDELLAEAGLSLDELLTYHKADLLCRHGWRDGSRLDLFADIDASAAAIEEFSDRHNADGYREFCAVAQRMFDTLQRTYIDAPRPNMLQFAANIGFTNISDMLALKPMATMWKELGRHFTDPRLQQLFGRYATYCGSSPYWSPSTLMLVAHVEQAGVWIADGGMHGVAKALATAAEKLGAEVKTGTGVARIVSKGDQVDAVELTDGTVLQADSVVFNGDVSALADGLLGDLPAKAKPITRANRSLSALTLKVHAPTSGFPLAHHNVFFSDHYAAEFEAVFDQRRLPEQPTTYICAQDRLDDGALPQGEGQAERLLLLVNAPPDGDKGDFTSDEIEQCLTNTQSQLETCGLKLDLTTVNQVRTGPSQFNGLFPATGGSLYGPQSKGMMAAFKRQGSRTALKGLYLAGGSVHPGSGVPMAVLSGRRAAESLVADRASMPKSRPGGISGGILTG
ncbi:MAG: 1-hydroxycarotenoid 3,4-desaturase CrtD [Pseudomonadota bacterium]